MLVAHVGSAQSIPSTIGEGNAEPWRTQIVSEAMELDKVFGSPQTLVRKRELQLWKPQKQRPIKELGGLSLVQIPTENPAFIDGRRSATQLPAPPFQIEGFVALTDDNVSVPPDCAGAVSPDHVITALNSEFRIQDRKGKSLQTLSMPRFWAPLGPFRSFLTDPRVAWDQNAKRWVMIMLADIGESTSSMLLARSTTPDPLGEWRMTRISTGLVNRDFDFPVMAIAGRSLAISASVYGGNFYEKTLNIVIPLANIYSATASLNYKTFDDFLGSSTPAADPDPNRSRILFTNSSIFISSGLYAVVFKNVAVAPDGSITPGGWVPGNAADIAAFSSGDVLPQLGSEIKINGGDSTMQNCTARGNNVWCVNSILVRFNTEFRTIIQYYRANWPESGDPSLLERIRIDDNAGANYYAFPSIAVNKNNEIFIGYNRFSRTQYAGSYFAFRRPTDPIGGLYFDAPLKQGEDSYTKGGLSNRWGDYSTTVVDPVDDTSFWTLQEYPASRTESGKSQWATYWARVALRSGPCTVRLDRTSADVPSTGGSLRIAATVPFADCLYLNAPNASWITTQASTTSGVTTTYDFQVGLNRSPNTRTATITLGSETFTVRQAANTNPPPAEPVLSVTKFDAPASARVGDSIALAATVRNIGTRGAGRFRIGFYLSTKTPVTNKDIFTGVGCPQNQGLVTDEVATCTGNYQLDATLTPGTYYLAAIADDRDELVLSDRTPSTRLSDSGVLTVQPAANAPAVTSTGVVHGATAVTGAISPGQILVIYGSRLGPAALTTLALDAQGRVTTTLGGSRVLFDGVPAPIIYTSAGQMSVIVPYSVSGKTTVAMAAEYNGLRSAAATLNVATSAPGLFSVDFSGKNQVAALNEDGSFNTAATPAERGKLIVLYGTGGGTFRSAPVDGAVIGLPLPEFLAPLTLEIGGIPAEVVYAGPAPGLVSGVFQINARIPESIPAGAQIPLIVRSGSIASPPGTTIAVK